MKTLFLIAGLIGLVFTSSDAAQSVTITPKKTIYKRKKPMADFKKIFEVTYPKVKAATPAISRRMETAIDPAIVLGVDIQEEINEVQWLEEAGYEVGYNKNRILSVMLFMYGAGAYPDGSSKYVVIDVKTGRRLKAGDLFTNLRGLVAKVKEAQAAEIEAGKVEIRKDPEMADTDADQLFASSDFTIKNLNEFAVSDTGVTFMYDYGFPHVIKALEPNGSYLITWAELKPFIKRPGLLARFVR